MEFVILAAGKSTRNYPHSKGLPHKSLMPLGSVKFIDRIMKEPIAAGIRHVTIVVADKNAKEAFEACFTREKNIEEKFAKSGNVVALELLQSLYIPDDMDIKYVIQKEPKGLAHATGLAARIAPGRHLAIRMPDDVIISRHVRREKEPFVASVLKKYMRDGIGGNLFVTRRVPDPKRWGIIEDGKFYEKPQESKSCEAAQCLWIFDRSFAALLAEKAKAADTKGTPEYAAAASGREIHHADFLNDFISEHPDMAIRTYPLGRDEIYLDGGTIQGYEEAMIYALLHESKFARHNRKVAKAQFGLRKWLSSHGPIRRH
jgi:UTP-glucose-1-phosphate uridylyltransferase